MLGVVLSVHLRNPAYAAWNVAGADSGAHGVGDVRADLAECEWDPLKSQRGKVLWQGLRVFLISASTSLACRWPAGQPAGVHLFDADAGGLDHPLIAREVAPHFLAELLARARHGLNA